MVGLAIHKIIIRVDSGLEADRMKRCFDGERRYYTKIDIHEYSYGDCM